MGCGAPLPAGTQFCGYCGRPAAAAAGAPGTTAPLAGAASLGPPPPPPSFPAAPTAPRSRPRRRWLRILIVVVVVVIVIFAALVVYSYYTTVDVTALNVYAPDNVCDLNGQEIFYTGFNGSTGSSVALSLPVFNNNTTSCTVHGVTTNTSGFGVEDVQLPPPIPGNTTGTAHNATLNLTLTLPGSRYTGVVNLVFR